MLRRVFKRFGTIDWREGRDRSGNESSSNCACRAISRSRSSMIPTIAVRRPLPQETTRSLYPMSPTRDHKVTIPNVSHRRPQSHDTQCLWERSPDRDFCNGPCRKSGQDESLGRRLRCAPAALPIIVESRLAFEQQSSEQNVREG